MLDANVLYTATLRSLLMDLAILGVYEAHWTARIQEEWQRNLLANRPELRSENLKRVQLLMEQALPGALIQVDEMELQGIELPDPDDLHVLAAAHRAAAEVIVTANLRDFPASPLAPLSLRAMSPDQFLVTLLEKNSGSVQQALVLQRDRYRNPPVTITDLLTQLSKQGAAEFAGWLQELFPQQEEQ